MIAVPSKASRRKAMEAYNRGVAARQSRSSSVVTGALTTLGLVGPDPWLELAALEDREATDRADSIYYAEMREEIASLDGGWLHGGFRFDDDDDDMDLPGMWSHADFTGGPPSEVRGPDWTRG